jgi:hypothetical protein
MCDDRGRQRRGDEVTNELPVHALTTGEALLVWGIRHWVACLKARTDPIPLMQAGFGSGRVQAAVAPLEALLLLTLDTATTPRDVRCIRCATVGDGERDLLAVVAFAQADRPLDAVTRLGEWLPPASARIGNGFVAEIARILRHRGLLVPKRPEYGAGRTATSTKYLMSAVPVSMAVH